MIFQALEGTLRTLVLEQWDRIPALRMIRQSADEIRERAERLAGGGAVTAERVVSQGNP